MTVRMWGVELHLLWKGHNTALFDTNTNMQYLEPKKDSKSKWDSNVTWIIVLFPYTFSIGLAHNKGSKQHTFDRELQE